MVGETRVLNTKFVIFTAISLSLVTVVYGSSISEVSARPIINTITCTTQSFPDGSKSITCCGKTDKPKQVGDECRTCTTDKDGHENCGSWELARTSFGSKLTENLQDLTAPATNDTKGPKPDILKDNITLQENNDNGKQPKTPRVPNDIGGLNDNGG